MLKLEKNSNMFEFGVEGSKKTYKLPAVSSLPITDILAIQKLSKHVNDDGEIDPEFETAALELFVSIVQKYEPDVVEALSYAQFVYLLEAYFSDVNVGE